MNKTPCWILTVFCAWLGCAAALVAAPVPGPEKLLPDDTLVMLTTPEFARLRSVVLQSAEARFWGDPAMKPFRDKFVTRWREELVTPLERELKVGFAELGDLLQGQLTFAITRNGWEGEAAQRPGFLLLLDAKDKGGQLSTNLANLRKQWVDSGRQLRTEKLREFEFTAVALSSNDIPKALERFIPRRLEYHELGEDPAPAPARHELYLGQVGSLLVVANSAGIAEKVVIRLTGGTAPSLGELAAYETARQSLFRDAPLYAWVNAKAVMEAFAKQAAQKKENPQAPSPVEVLKLDKLLAASGVMAVQSLALSYTASGEGGLWQLFVAVPESARTGLVKLLAGEPKEATPPPFVPADAVRFQRWRLDGQKLWATLEKILAEVSPQSVSAINFLLDTANLAAREKDPGFDIRKNLLGNLGDDMVEYEKAPRGTTNALQLQLAPSIFLLGSPNAEQLTGSLKNILIFMTAQAGAPEEREFLGRKIYSVTLPGMPLNLPGAAPSQPPTPRTLHYCASSGYTAFSTDASILEEYLRSGESQVKALRETSGLVEATQRVVGPGTSFFGYQNNTELMRGVFDVLKHDPGASTNLTSLRLLGAVPGMTRPEQTVKAWMDFSLLPSYDTVSKYFHFSVSGSSATSDGLTYRWFAPTPPGMNTGR